MRGASTPRLWAFSRPVLLILRILALRSDSLSYPTHLLFWALQYPISHSSPKTSIHNPICTPHTTHTHIIQYTPRTRRYSLHPHLILLYHTVLSSQCLDLCSILYFPERSVRFALIHFFYLLLPVSFLTLLLFVNSSICALPLSLSPFFSTSQFALRGSRHLEYRHSRFSELGMLLLVPL